MLHHSLSNQSQASNDQVSAEQLERERAARRERFYREYADHELSRIITSMMQEQMAT